MEMHPGITDSVQIQREMIDEMETSGLRCAIIWHFSWSASVLDERKRNRMSKLEGIGSTLLDEWFHAEFEPVLERGEYVVLWRRDAEPPNLHLSGGS